MGRISGLFRRLDEAAEHWLFDVVFATRTRTLGVLTAVGVGLYMCMAPCATLVTCEASPSVAAAEAQSLDLLIDRPWFDGYPVNPTPQKPYHAYMFTSDGMGLFVTLKSRYRQEIELFYFKLKGEKIEIYLPETKTKASGRVSITDANGPGDFDVKLSLAADPKNEGKAADYYSWRHWGAGNRVDLALEKLER